jgi:hypothetical protein
MLSEQETAAPSGGRDWGIPEAKVSELENLIGQSSDLRSNSS